MISNGVISSASYRPALGLDGAQVRFQREGILRLAADSVLGDFFSGQAHAVGNAHVFIAGEDGG